MFQKRCRQEKNFSPQVQKDGNTYNSGCTLVVTCLTANPPVLCLDKAERTESFVFSVLWSYVKRDFNINIYNARQTIHQMQRNTVTTTSHLLSRTVLNRGLFCGSRADFHMMALKYHKPLQDHLGHNLIAGLGLACMLKDSNSLNSF